MENNLNLTSNERGSKEPLFPEELKISKLTLEYLLCSEFKTHPTAALVTLFTIASALTARKIYTETKMSTTLYQILVAKTGAGKNMVVNSPMNILDTIEYSNLIIPSKISSIGALDDIFKQQNVVVQIVDEFGDHLGSMMNDKGGHLKSLAAKIKNLYSLTNGIYSSGRYSSAGGKQKTAEPWSISDPCFSITGVTTHTQLLKNLTDDLLHDGFINRFIILNGNNIEPVFNEKVFEGVPQELVAHISLLDKNDSQNDASVRTIIPLSKKAKTYYHKFIGDADIKGSDICKFCVNDKSDLNRAISVRWRENSLRLATALTAFENLKEVSLDALKWCYLLIKNSSIEFMDLFEKESRQTRYQVQKEKAIQWFESKGIDQQFTRTYLARNSRPFSSIKSKERLELLEDLIELGHIEYNVEKGVSYYKFKSS